MTIHGDAGSDGAGSVIFLSAGVPDVIKRHPPQWTRDAVLAITRAALKRGFRIRVAAHPSIAPMVLAVAREFPQPARPPIEVYLSRFFVGRHPAELFELADGQCGILHEIEGGVDEPGSAALLREEMLSRPGLIAGIFVGGMDDVRTDGDHFVARHPDLPAYAIASTGGAAADLFARPDDLFAGGKAAPLQDRTVLDTRMIPYTRVARAVFEAIEQAHMTLERTATPKQWSGFLVLKGHLATPSDRHSNLAGRDQSLQVASGPLAMAALRNPAHREESNMAILGDLGKRIESAARARDKQVALRDKLVATSELHLAFSFDAISDSEKRLEYEPRCTASCNRCHTVWAGSKAGEILDLELAPKGHKEKVRFDGGVRALVHVHRLGQLIAGLDTGYLLVFNSFDLSFRGRCHPARSLALGETQLRYEANRKLEEAKAPDRFLYGITALLELPEGPVDLAAEVGGNGHVDIVVATRAPELLVVRLEHHKLTIRARHRLPGWCRCLTLTGKPGHEALVCVTHSGEFLDWDCHALRSEVEIVEPHRSHTSLLPAAVARPSGPRYVDSHALFIGASDGLYIRRSRDGKPVHVAVTRSAVLSIATVEVAANPDGTDARTYVALGLEDGRLRVIEQQALFDVLDGGYLLDAHDFRVDLGNAVLALQILETTDDETSRFVFAALRNHRLRLFRVRSRDALLRDLLPLWHEYIEAPIGIEEPNEVSELQLTALLDREQRLRNEVGVASDNALRYLLVDQVLPRWARALKHRRKDVVARACAVTRGADDRVLYRLSATMGDIASGDASALMALSRACLVAMPQHDAQRWRAFVSYHLKQLHGCIRREELANDLPTLQQWDRFVRKYLLLGETFAEQRFGLVELMQRNRQTRKHLDALIYAAQLEHQGYDFKWSTIARRDEQGRPQEIVRVDLIDHVAIVVTASAEIVFYHVNGEPLPLFQHGRQLDRLHLAPERGPGVTGVIRARAARFGRKKKSWIRIALSWVGESRLEDHQLRVTVFDLEFAADRIVLKDVRVATLDGQREAVGATSDRGSRRATGAEVDVHGLVGVSEQDAFLVGLDSSESPLALLRLCTTEDGTESWVLSRLEMARPGSQHAVPAALSTPVRAVAVLELETPGRYLGAAGAADGSLRLVEFDLEGKVMTVDTEPTGLVYPINDIALAPRCDDDHYGYVCYAGTETGESVSLLVRIDPKLRQIHVKQLWRDLHGKPVIAVRPTRRPDPAKSPEGSTEPLLYPDDVVFVTTQDGHVSIYHAAHGKAETVPLSRSNNYYFEGMRFDRVDLPAKGLTSWAIRRNRSGFLAAYTGGELCFGELHAPRESTQYQATRAHTDELLGEVSHAQMFYGDNTEPRTLEICEMIRIGGGALRSYVLRRQLERYPWDTLDGDELEDLLTEHLEGLRAEVDEERDRIKVIVEMVSNQVLDRKPQAILDDCRPGKANQQLTDWPKVRQVCQYLARRVLDTAVQPSRGAVRVRMASVHALLRVNVFWHAAPDEMSGHQIPDALQAVLTACLRDDDRIVRVEALRAVAVALRNISVLFTRAKGDHLDRLRVSFFPRGLRTVQWLVDTLLENYARYRHHGDPMLLSTPWSYVTALVAVIRLFPGDALELCAQISSRGLGDSLELIADRLRGGRVGSLRTRIRHLWIVPAIRQPAIARDEFIRLFDDCSISQRLTDYGIDHRDADHDQASGLLHVYRRLALLWKVNYENDIATIPERCHRADAVPELTGSLAGVPELLAKFSQIASAPQGERPRCMADLRTASASELGDGREPPEPVRLALQRVVEHWQSLLKLPATREHVAGYTLGAIVMDRPHGLVYASTDPDRVIKVLHHPLDTRARQKFNRDARLSRELADRYPDCFVPVEELDPTFGYAVMKRFDLATKLVAELGASSSERSKLAGFAGAQLARALRCLHAENLTHGDLRAENVFVADEGSGPRFRLGDLQVSEDSSERSTAALLIPSSVRGNCPSGVAPKVWIDLLSLTLFVHRILTGETLEPDLDEGGLAAKMAELGERGDAVSRTIARMLDAPCRSAEELEIAIASDVPDLQLPAFARKKLAGRATAAFDVFISYDSVDIAVARELYTELTKRRVVPYLDERHATQDDRNATQDRWRLEIAHAVDQSRAFAILVGERYREDSLQAKEVRAARLEARKDRLPFIVFLLGGDSPPKVDETDPVIRAGKDAKAMADYILRSFQHPIEPPK